MPSATRCHRWTPGGRTDYAALVHRDAYPGDRHGLAQVVPDPLPVALRGPPRAQAAVTVGDRGRGGRPRTAAPPPAGRGRVSERDAMPAGRSGAPWAPRSGAG